MSKIKFYNNFILYSGAINFIIKEYMDFEFLILKDLLFLAK